MYYGCAWYPEHWPEDRWAVDLELMRRAEMNVVRIAEFAWSKLEPAEGQYDLDWLERAVNAAQKHGIRCVIGTPTAAPPVWLTGKYPDTLRVNSNGQRAPHGGRVHFSAASQRYRQFCGRIAGQMAKRLGQHPNVIGWQIDNEYSEYTYDPEAIALWREWLRKRYGSLDELNRRWTTGYWSQTFFEWDQVSVPAFGAWLNPCIQHEYKRFMTDVFRDYQRVQIDAIRQHARADQWITHNFHGTDNFDFPVIAQDLDRASWDVYVGFSKLDPRSVGWISDIARGISGSAQNPKPHWVMECQPNHVLYGDVPIHLDPGEVRRMVWHFVGHGAEGVLFWQWRVAFGSHEQYWGTILASDGTPRPVFQELSKLGQELSRVSELLRDATPPKAKVALLHQYADRWALLGQRHHSSFDVRQLVADWYAAARRLGLDVDVIDPHHRPLDGYALVLAPSLHLIDDDLAAQLTSYVRDGGHLVLGPRSGLKDCINALLPSRQPGSMLGELLGATVSDFYPIREPHSVEGLEAPATAKIWAEPLDVRSAQVETLLTFGAAPAGSHGNGWLPGKPAAVRRRVNTGSISYVGAWLDLSGMTSLVQRLAIDATLPIERLPEGLEICRRPARGGGEVTILINHGSAPVDVGALRGQQNLIGTGPLAQTLAPGEVAVVRS